MKTFRVTAPDGRVLNVQGDDPEGAAQAAAEYVKANPLQGVDAYKADQREQMRRADLYTQNKTGKAPEAGKPTERQAVNDFFNGMTLGGWGQLMAAGAAGATGLQNLTADVTGGKKLPYGMKDAYVGQRQLDNADQRQFASEHPVASAGVGIAGGLAMPGAGAVGKFVAGSADAGKLAGVKAMLESSGLLPRIVRSAAAGGAMGAASGALTSDPGREAQGAVRGGAVGAVAGAAVPAVGAVVGKAARTVGGLGQVAARVANKATGGELMDPQVTAIGRLTDALKADGATPDVIESVASQWASTGAPPPKLLDIAAGLPSGGQNTLRLLRAAASKGSAANIAVKHLDQTAADLQDAAIGRTRQITPETRPVGEVAAGIKAARTAEGQKLYPAFMDERVPVDADLLSATSGGTGAKWLDHAASLAEAERNAPLAQEIKALAGKSPPQDISAGALDYVRRGMRDAADEHFAAGRGQLGAALKERSKDVEGALMKVPGFDAARSAWAERSGQLDALDTGLGVLNADPETFAADVGKMSPQARDALKVGARQAITTAVGNPAEGSTGLLNRLSTATNTRRNLSTLLGEEDAGKYMDAIGKAVDQLKNARFLSPNTNSATFSKLEDAGLVDVPAIPTSKAGMIAAVINKLRSGATLTDDERKILVQMGVSDAGEAAPVLAPKLTPKASRPTILPYFAPAVGAYAGRQDR